MKKLFLATTAVVALAAGSAGAADMAVKARPLPPPPPPCAQFGGWYFGGHVGWNYYKHEYKDLDQYGLNAFTLDNVSNLNNNDSDWHGGAQGGYNWQSGCALFGVQVDWSYTNSNADSFHRDSLTPGDGDASLHSQLRWFGTARARTGVVVDSLLLYVTGGAAFARFNRDFTWNEGIPTRSATFSTSRTRFGYVVGAGTEWAINQNWSLVSEFMYMGFEKDDRNFACPAAATCAGQPVGSIYRFQFNDSVWVSRIGLNYRFNYAPVVAKY